MNFEKRDILTRSGKRRIEVRFWNGTGETRIELRRRFKSVREANEFVDQQLNSESESQRRSKQNGPDPMTERSFGEEFTFWREVKLADWSPGRSVAVDQYVRDFGVELTNAKVGDIRPEFLKRLEAGLRKQGDSGGTIRHKIGMIKAVLNHSVEMERIPYNPVARYRLPKMRSADVVFWETNEAKSFLDFAQAKYPTGSEGFRNFVSYLVALNTAVRAGELWAMRVQSIRPSLNAIQLTEQYHAVTKGFRQLKGKQGRAVPLNTELLCVLNAWIKQGGLNSTDLLFTNSRGNPIDHNNFYDRVFIKDVEEWGGRKIKFHGLRHTAATLMLDQGINIRSLQRILGHKDLETTERYVHALGRSIQDAAEIFSLMPTTNLTNPAPPEQPPKKRHLSVVS